jgi:hypothetical protein
MAETGRKWKLNVNSEDGQVLEESRLSLGWSVWDDIVPGRHSALFALSIFWRIHSESDRCHSRAGHGQLLLVLQDTMRINGKLHACGIGLHVIRRVMPTCGHKHLQIRQSVVANEIRHRFNVYNFPILRR